MEEKDKRKVALKVETDGTRYIINKEKIADLENKNKFLSSEILNGLDELNTKTYSFSANDVDNKLVKYTFTKAERSKVIYDNEKVKEAVGKKAYAQIVDREFIADWNKLVELAKKYGIDKNEILECVTINETVNSNKLKEAHELGVIDLKKLKGTFTIDSSAYLMTRKS